MIKKRFLLLLVCIIFTGIASSFADGLQCDRCGNEIEGRYFQYKADNVKLNICLECNKKLPRCEACKLPFHRNQLNFHKGERLCRKCLSTAKYCSICDKRIKGRYYKLENSDVLYCARCYLNIPKCVVCNKPVPRRQLDPSSGACQDCLKKLPRCETCGKAIVGSFFRYKYSDGVYCPECHSTRNKCYTCGVPVGEHYWRFPDGRTICDDCHDRCIYDDPKIRNIMKEVENLVIRRIGIKAEIPYKLTITQLNSQSSTVAKAAKSGRNKTSPLFGKELGLFRRLNGESEIFLLYGLPPAMIYETAAHEYAHAWQAENCPQDQSLELREGFAQWVASQILRIKGFEKAFEKMEARSDYPYGTGYRRFKNIHQNLGLQKLLEYAQKATQ